MTRFDVDQFVSDCLDAAHHASAAASAVRQVVERAVSEPTLVAQTLGHKLGKDVGILHYSSELTVEHVILPPRHRTGIHDHRVWAVIGTWGGHEDNHLYREDALRGLTEVNVTRCAEREVMLLGPEAIHEVIAPTDRWSAALHVYGGALADQPRSEWRGSPAAMRPLDEHAYFSRYLEELADAELLAD